MADLSPNLDQISNKSWLARKAQSGLVLHRTAKKNITIILPSKMNFRDDYEKTSATIEAIRRFTRAVRMPVKEVALRSVDFSRLEKISTSAALVLTAELSRWEDANHRKLRARLSEWDSSIKAQLSQLGFFDLFEMTSEPEEVGASAVLEGKRLVRYIKAKFDDTDAPFALEDRIQEILGKDVEKWLFLQSALTEAVANVSHHAYPPKTHVLDKNKVWYLTGSFDPTTGELKVVFYDQGIGIPSSLPASTSWEKILDMAAKKGVASGRRDATLIEAAMEIARTSTGEVGRGKGLNDLVEFCRMRGNGYLSIFSERGLYRIQFDEFASSSKAESFENKICGTLIIWSTKIALGDS